MKPRKKPMSPRILTPEAIGRISNENILGYLFRFSCNCGKVQDYWGNRTYVAKQLFGPKKFCSECQTWVEWVCAWKSGIQNKKNAIDTGKAITTREQLEFAHTMAALNDSILEFRCRCGWAGCCSDDLELLHLAVVERFLVCRKKKCGSRLRLVNRDPMEGKSDAALLP